MLGSRYAKIFGFRMTLFARQEINISLRILITPVMKLSRAVKIIQFNYKSSKMYKVTLS